MAEVALQEERRRHWRFAQSSRVEFLQNGRRSVSFLGNLSLGGFALRSADNLTPGESIEFVIYLEDGQPAMNVQGVVRACQNGRAHVAFVPDQPAQEARLLALLPPAPNAAGRRRGGYPAAAVPATALPPGRGGPPSSRVPTS